MTSPTRRVLAVLFTITALSGCAMEAAESPDGIDEIGVIPGGKADGSDYSPCELDAVVDRLNMGASAEEIYGWGVHRRASNNLVTHRDGADGVFGTEDDALFADIREVDAVSWVGPVAIRQLVEATRDACDAPPISATEVIMSPQDYEESHLARLVELVDGAERSIDIGMYSFRDTQLTNALARAVGRGVTIRFVFESAGDHRSDPEGTTSARLEELGIEVRWINKIMHHKFAIIDGPRADLAYATEGTLATGSGNWSNSAATRYDENTLIVRGNAELNLRYQREFNLIWDNGRLFVWNEDIPAVPHVAITDADITDDPDVHAVFTSANFRTYESTRYGPTFSLERGRNEVSDTWVELIEGARTSIRIASGHLRSRPIVEALIAAQEANPALDVRVYLDGQEYASEYTDDRQNDELQACLIDAGTSEAQQQNCRDRGFLFSYRVHHAGIALRFKYYAYRWDYSYAAQMHHKYMVIDEQTLITGSYNLSDNAEHNTMENDLIVSGAAFQSVVDAYVDNFDELWVTGEEEGRFASYLDDVENGTTDFPIVFPAMAIDWAQVTQLKRAIRAACPEINSSEYRTNAARHRYCDR